MTTMIVELYEALRAAGHPKTRRRRPRERSPSPIAASDRVDIELAAIRGELKAVEALKSSW